MGEILTGKDVKFYFGDIVAPATKPPEIDVANVALSVAATEKGTTTSTTAGDGKESTIIRKKYSVKVEGTLENASGKKITGNTLALTVGGVAKNITKVNYEVQYDEHNTTNSSTPAGFTHSTAVRASRKGKMDIWVEDEADIALEDTAAAVVITFDTGHTVTGNAKFSNKDPQGEVEGVSKNSYALTFQGAPTEVGLGIPMAVKTDCLIEFATGKTYSGKAIAFGKVADCEADGELKMSYTIVFVDTVTEG